MTEVLPSVAAAEGTALYAWLLVALPAFGALVLLAGGRRTNAWGHLLGCATVLAAFGYGVALFSQTLGFDAAQRTRELGLGTFFAVNSLQVNYGLRLDPLSLTFDYQFVANPAFNADRGPVSIFAARIHIQL